METCEAQIAGTYREPAANVDGDSRIASIAAFSSSRKAAATEALRSKYQARDVSASAAACGWRRISSSAQRPSAPEALFHHIPGNTLHRTRFEVRAHAGPPPLARLPQRPLQPVGQGRLRTGPISRRALRLGQSQRGLKYVAFLGAAMVVVYFSFESQGKSRPLAIELSSVARCCMNLALYSPRVRSSE